MRNLHDFGLVSDDILTPSRFDVEVQQRELFRVDYVYGLGSMGFSYLLTVQRTAVLATEDHQSYHTQIARVCQNDASMYSYTELPLECHSEITGTNYNILTAAFVTHPGEELSKHLGLASGLATDVEHILVTVFSSQKARKSGTVHSGGGAGGRSSSGVAVCVFTMQEVRQRFTDTIQQCFRGTGSTGPDHFVQPKLCLKTVSRQLLILDYSICCTCISPDSCNNDDSITIILL